MIELSNIRLQREKFTKQYRLAVYSYLAPVWLFVLHLVDAYTFDIVSTLFLSVSFLSVLPAGCAGIFFTVKGMSLAIRQKDYEKKDIGYANLIMGIIMVLAGMLAAGLTYVMVSG